MYRWLLLKRRIEDLLMWPFIVFGRLIARYRPLKNEYRIYFFFPFYHTGGAEKVHAQIARACGGKDAIIFFTRKSHDTVFLKSFVDTGCTIRDISAYTDNKWLYPLNIIFRGIISAYINQQSKKPVVLNGQCNFGYKLSPWIDHSVRQVELIHSFNSFSYIRTPFLPFISETVMISHQRIQDHLDYYRTIGVPRAYDSKIRYICNGVALPAHPEKKSSGLFRVIYVGRSTSEKRVHLFLEIASRLKDQSGFSFEIMGDMLSLGNLSEYSFVTFHGNQSSTEKINQLYREAHVLVITSSTEGFPLVVMEAMGWGCAILGTPVGDMPYHIRDGENGYLFSTSKEESIIIEEACRHLLYLHENTELRNRMFELNTDYARAHFSIQQFNESYQRLLKYPS